jgi:hypothetical protein
MHRAATWRKYLIGNEDVILEKRKMYHNIIINFPYSIDNAIDTTIKRDLPRTSFKGSQWLNKDILKSIDTLLYQYVQVMPCDSYMQGFAYIMAVLYYTYETHDKEHALADTFWSFASVISIIRPLIPDHDPEHFLRYTKEWKKYYMYNIECRDKRTHMWLKPFYDMITPTLSVKWIMIWFSQQFDLENLLIIWDAIITCEPTQRTKLFGIIASNITIQNSTSIEQWAEQHPTEIGPRIMSIGGTDAKIIIEESRNAMIQYKIPSII